MEYRSVSIPEAMNFVVNDRLLKINGVGGMVGVDAKGNAAMMFNCEGMYRGMKSSQGRKEIAIYK